MKDSSSGVLYLCTGSYHDMLKNSLRSLKETNEGLDFHVLSDRPLAVPHTWVPRVTGKASRTIKTRLSDYTPFDLTMFVDTDTVLGEAIDLEDMLGDADLAMGLDADPELGRGARVFLNYGSFTSAEEVEETVGMCGESFPFFNSGVMVWRQSERVRAFFERWHSEWLKYKRADQLALARTLFSTDTRVKTLDRRFNFPVVSRNFTRDKAIYHLIFKEGMAKQVGLWNPAFPGLMDAGLSQVLADGMRAANQYLHIGKKIHDDVGSSVLIVCPGGDEYFWRSVSRNNCKFVVEPGHSIEGAEGNACVHKFDSKVGQWLEEVHTPEEIDRPFDYVVVNGPKGFDSHCPGREIPVAWASKLARKEIFVFDTNRDWERQLCYQYLGMPSHVVEAEGKGNAQLAVFDAPARRAAAQSEAVTTPT